MDTFTPRPPIVKWLVCGDLVVETDLMYHGYTEIFRGRINDDIEEVFNMMGIDVPPNPRKRRA